MQHFLDEPLVYFHKVDKLNRPVLIVNLAYLPKAPADCYVTEFLTPLVIFVLETARLLTWDLTKQRTEEGIENPLVLDTVVLVEFKNANSLPTVGIIDHDLPRSSIHSLFFLLGHYLIKIICHTTQKIPRNDWDS